MRKVNSMRISNSDLINIVENTTQRLREIESIASNLGTTIEYENPIDHKCHSAYSISRNAIELIIQLEKVLFEISYKD